MRLNLNSVRSKMLFPALVAIAAIVIAAVVTATVSYRAVKAVGHATNEDVASVRVFTEVRRQLEAADTELRAAVAGGNPDSVDVAQEFYDHAIQMLKDAKGQKVIDATVADEIQGQLEDYFKAARADALTRAQKAQRERQAAGAQLRENANAEIAAVSGPYQTLTRRMDTEAHAAMGVIDNRLAELTHLQVVSVVLVLVILLAAGVGSGLLAWWLSGRTARPLKALSQLTTRVAEGDLTLEVPVSTNDEIGVLADGFRRMVTRVREIVSTLKSAAEELGIAAERLNDATRAQAGILEQQASGVAETGSTTRELEQTSAVAANRAATVLEVAKRAADMSDSGRSAAERSAEELKRIQESIEAIVGQTGQMLEQARQVVGIVSTVRDLAGQSHILSLNASIEAARAGDAGKGFAVVAQEVRALADQSGKSAARVAKMVQEILSAVQATRTMTSRGSDAMAGSIDQIRASGDSLRDIGGIVRESSEAVQQIARVVQEQFAGIGHISTAMRDLDKGMEETVGRIRSLEESAQQVAETAVRISGIAGEFKV